MHVDHVATGQDDQQPPKKPKFYQILYVQVIFAIVAGILLGHFFPEFGESLKPLGEAFIKLVKMIIAPVIFLTVVTGIAGMKNLGSVGRVTGKAMIYFLTFSTLALIVGLIVGNVIEPGHGLNIDPSTLHSTKVDEYAAKAHESTITGFLMNIIPDTLISPFVSGQILQVLFVAVLFGLALAKSGDLGRPITDFLQQLTTPVFNLVGMLMKFAPIGAFGAMAFTIGAYGISSIGNLMLLIATFYITALLFVIIILGAVARYNGFSIIDLIRYIKDELWLVLGTSSSEAALPSLMAKMEKAGCEKSVVGLVIPTGYSFNLDGTNIYMTLPTKLVNARHSDMKRSIPRINAIPATGIAGTTESVAAKVIKPAPVIPAAPLELNIATKRIVICCVKVSSILHACAINNAANVM